MGPWQWSPWDRGLALGGNTQPAAEKRGVQSGRPGDIGQQVEVMILDAKHASENRVGKEIQKIKPLGEAYSPHSLCKA